MRRTREIIDILLFLFAYFLALSVFKALLRKRENIVGFASTYFTGNIKYLHEEMNNDKRVEIYFVTSSKNELERLKPSNLDSYSGIDIKRIPLFLRTSIWVTSHGRGNIPFVGVMNYLSNSVLGLPYRHKHGAKWVDVWHGLAFKHTEREKMLRDYDIGFVTSTFFKEYYSKKTGISHKLKITGYPRTDPLIKKACDEEEIRKRIGVPLNKKNILYAPTYGYKWSEQCFPWGDMNSVIGAIEQFCERKHCNFLIRMHPNWYKQNITLKEKLEAMAKQSKHIFHLPSSKYVDTEPILLISDVLITGWSSIANDFILLDRPIIFLEVELPKKEFVLKPEERAGFIVKGEREFFEKLEEALVHPNSHEEERRVLIKKLYRHLDGNSSKRCAREIIRLLEE